MKLNHDCVRECLIYIENNIELFETLNPKAVVSDLSINSNYSEDDIVYSLEKLQEVGYIDGGIETNYDIQGKALPLLSPIKDITWEGHEYLNTIRDNKIWKKTKEIASNFKSVPLSMMGTIGSQILGNYIQSKMGFK